MQITGCQNSWWIMNSSCKFSAEIRKFTRKWGSWLTALWTDSRRMSDSPECFSAALLPVQCKQSLCRMQICKLFMNHGYVFIKNTISEHNHVFHHWTGCHFTSALIQITMKNLVMSVNRTAYLSSVWGEWGTQRGEHTEHAWDMGEHITYTWQGSAYRACMRHMSTYRTGTQHGRAYRTCTQHGRS